DLRLTSGRSDADMVVDAAVHGRPAGKRSAAEEAEAPLAALGAAALARKDVEAARSTFRKMLAANAKSLRARLGLTAAAFLAGDVDAARREAADAVALAPDSGAARSLLIRAL